MMEVYLLRARSADVQAVAMLLRIVVRMLFIKTAREESLVDGEAFLEMLQIQELIAQ